MRARDGILLYCGLVALALAGCRPVNDQPGAAASVPVVTAVPTVEELPVPATQPSLTPDAQLAVADLAQRLGVDPKTIAVVRVEEVDWPDGSLGCPQPDMRYKQVLVNGVFIQLAVDGQFYNYHGGGGRRPSLCISKDEVLPEDLPGELRGDPDV
jgi:hypothetical protein